MSSDSFSFSGKEQLAEKVNILSDAHRCLIIHNDDFNTFDFVIDTLVEICGHTPIQAEQCALIIHNSGKCTVKTGSFREIQPIWAELIARGLTSTIEEKVI